MQNRKLPVPGGVSIVVEVLDKPIKSREDPNSGLYNEDFDIKYASLAQDGDLVVFLGFSQRFEPAVIQPIVEQADAPAAEESLEA